MLTPERRREIERATDSVTNGAVLKELLAEVDRLNALLYRARTFRAQGDWNDPDIIKQLSNAAYEVDSSLLEVASLRLKSRVEDVERLTQELDEITGLMIGVDAPDDAEDLDDVSWIAAIPDMQTGNTVEHYCDTEEEAIAAVRKAAGLDSQ
jgi:hypothetical protein